MAVDPASAAVLSARPFPVARHAVPDARLFQTEALDPPLTSPIEPLEPAGKILADRILSPAASARRGSEKPHPASSSGPLEKFLRTLDTQPSKGAMISIDGPSGLDKVAEAEKIGTSLKNHPVVVIDLNEFMKPQPWRYAIQKRVAGMSWSALTPGERASITYSEWESISRTDPYSNEENFWDNPAILLRLKKLRRMLRHARPDQPIPSNAVIFVVGKYANREDFEAFYDFKARLTDEPRVTMVRHMERFGKINQADRRWRMNFYARGIMPSWRSYEYRTKGALQSAIIHWGPTEDIAHNGVTAASELFIQRLTPIVDHERQHELSREAYRLAILAQMAGLNPPDILPRIAEMAEVFHQAGQIQHIQSEISQRVFSRDVLEFLSWIQFRMTLRKISARWPECQKVMHELLESEPFVCREFLAALTAGYPTEAKAMRIFDYLTTLGSNANLSTSEFWNDLIAELSDNINQELNPVHFTSPEDFAKARYDHKLKLLQQASHIGYVHIGLLFLREMKQTQGDNKILETLSRAQAELSERLFQAAHDAAMEYMVALYGTPRLRTDPTKISRSAYFLGGTGARKQFPSFDYDATGLYEEDGQTSGASRAPISNIQFFTELTRTMEHVIAAFDHELDLKFFWDWNEPVWSVERLRRRRTSRMYPLIIYAAGDREFAEKQISNLYAHAFPPEKRQESMAYTAFDIGTLVYKSETKRNVKWDALQFLSWIVLLQRFDALQPDLRIQTVENLIDNLAPTYLTRDEQQKLNQKYLWLLRLRIHLDLFFGRNNKELPTGPDLERFVKAFGYRDVDSFEKDFQNAAEEVRRITALILSSIFEREPVVLLQYLVMRYGDSESRMDASAALRGGAVIGNLPSVEELLDQARGNPLAAIQNFIYSMPIFRKLRDGLSYVKLPEAEKTKLYQDTTQEFFRILRATMGDLIAVNEFVDTFLLQHGLEFLQVMPYEFAPDSRNDSHFAADLKQELIPVSAERLAQLRAKGIDPEKDRLLVAPDEYTEIGFQEKDGIYQRLPFGSTPQLEGHLASLARGLGRTSMDDLSVGWNLQAQLSDRYSLIKIRMVHRADVIPMYRGPGEASGHLEYAVIENGVPVIYLPENVLRDPDLYALTMVTALLHLAEETSDDRQIEHRAVGLALSEMVIRETFQGMGSLVGRLSPVSIAVGLKGLMLSLSSLMRIYGQGAWAASFKEMADAFERFEIENNRAGFVGRTVSDVRDAMRFDPDITMGAVFELLEGRLAPALGDFAKPFLSWITDDPLLPPGHSHMAAPKGWVHPISLDNATTKLDPVDELDILHAFRGEILKKLQGQKSMMPKVVVISDQHGTIDKFDNLIIGAIRSVLPSGKIPVDFQLDPARPLGDQLRELGVDPERDLIGKIFFHNLGDFMDRGTFGVRVFRRSQELKDAGLSDYVVGNHDLWEFMNLQGFHLPTYAGYELYGYKDGFDKKPHGGRVQTLLKRRHKTTDNTQAWWATRYAEYMAHNKNLQKERWNDRWDVEVVGPWEGEGKEKKRVEGQGLFDKVSPTLAQDPNGDVWKKLWFAFRGWNKNKQDISTGTRAVGQVSLVWWQNLLEEFKKARREISENPDLAVNIQANQAWARAIEIMEQEIIPELQADIEGQLLQGNWWWRIFEALHAKNYTSPEWWAADWVFHEGWGTSVLKEINAELDGSSGPTITNADYLENPSLKEISRFFKENFQLYIRDIYQNVYVHAFLPVDAATGEFYFTYKGVEYRGKGTMGHPSVWEGLDILSKDIRTLPTSQLYDALTLVNSWYADNTTIAKPQDVAKAINQFGPGYLAEVNGAARIFSGHIPFYEFSDPKKIPPEDQGVIRSFAVLNEALHGFIFTDHGMGEKFGARGADVEVWDQIKLWGYEHKGSQAIKKHPGTLKNKKNPEDPDEYLFENPPVESDRFLPQLLKDVGARIVDLERILAAPGETHPGDRHMLAAA